MPNKANHPETHPKKQPSTHSILKYRMPWIGGKNSQRNNRQSLDVL